MLCIADLNNPKKIDASTPKIIGHKGKVIDFEFSPFDDDIIATGACDGILRIWQIPEQMTENMLEPLITLTGH